jgi:hypothetical protein
VSETVIPFAPVAKRGGSNDADQLDTAGQKMWVNDVTLSAIIKVPACSISRAPLSAWSESASAASGYPSTHRAEAAAVYHQPPNL